MAKAKTLDLTIKIAGQLDKSLTTALNSTQNRLKNLSKVISNVGSAGLAAMGSLAAGTVKALSSCTEQAVQYQNAMGDVIKYVDGLADAQGVIGSNKIFEGNGKTYAENYEGIYDAILDITTIVPMTKEEIAELTANLGQSGKSIEQLFTLDKNGHVSGGLIKDAATVAAAWDITADEAADYSAKWENAFNLSHDQVMELMDQINYLGANNATTAAEIASAVNTSASMGQIAGIDPSTTAALATAMLSTGVAANRVGTSIKRMATNLSRGEDMTKKQKAVLEELGFTAQGVAKGLTTDSIGTLSSLFHAIGELPQEKQLNAITQLFGQWAAESGAKVVGNMPVYEEALRMITPYEYTDNTGRTYTKKDYNNSMQREFDIKTQTPEAIRMMRNSAIEQFQVHVGESFLPVVAQFDNAVREIFLQLDDNLPQITAITDSLAILASRGITAVGNAIQNALPYIQKALDYIINNGDTVKKVIVGLLASFTGMKFAPAITNAGIGIGNALFGQTNPRTGIRSGGLVQRSAARTQRLGQYVGSAFSSIRETGPIGAVKGLWNTARRSVQGNGAYQGVRNYAGNVAGAARGLWGALPAGLRSIPGELGTEFRSMASGIASSRVGQGIAGAGRAIAGGPVGRAVSTVGRGAASLVGGIAGGASRVGGVARAAAPALGAGMNMLGTAFSPITSALAPLFTHSLPIVGAISGVIAIVSILGDNLDGIRNIIRNVFGEKGVEVFNGFITVVQNIGNVISGFFEDGSIAKAVEPLRNMFGGLFEDEGAKTVALGTFDGIISIAQSVMGVVGQLVEFANTTVKPIILEIYRIITETVMPIIMNVFSAAAPYISGIITNIGTGIMTVASIIGQAIQFALPIIENVIAVVGSIASVVVPAVLAGIQSLSAGVLEVINSIKTVFQGLIDFVTSVFTGDWQGAWQAVQDIFGGIFEGLKALFKTPINAVLSMINGVIDRINGLKLKIPDWVPLLGGKEFNINIPKFSLLAKGGFTNGPSIAGEAGTEAVISFDRAVRAKNIATWQQAGSMLGLGDLDSTNSASINVSFSPSITIQGNADRKTVDEALRDSEARFESWLAANFDRLLERSTREQYRRAYA